MLGIGECHPHPSAPPTSPSPPSPVAPSRPPVPAVVGNIVFGKDDDCMLDTSNEEDEEEEEKEDDANIESNGLREKGPYLSKCSFLCLVISARARSLLVCATRCSRVVLHNAANVVHVEARPWRRAVALTDALWRQRERKPASLPSLMQHS